MSATYFDTKRKIQHMDARLSVLTDQEQRAFQELFDIVWVYHDNGLEGEVYTPDELRAALTDQVVTVADSSSTTVLRDIRSHKAALEYIRLESRKRNPERLLQLVKNLHERLTPDTANRPGKYRRAGQNQRSYLHEIADANRISYLLRKLLAWVVSEEAQRDHPIDVASTAHYEFVHIFPFDKNSAKVGRLLLNYLLMREGYPPAVIHAEDRQRYYEAFRSSCPDALTKLIHDSIENSIESVDRRLRDMGVRPTSHLRLAFI